MLFDSQSPEYARATTPRNSSLTQRPAAVAVPTTASQAAQALADATDRGLTVVPQATGHGAGAEVGASDLLVDTAGLDRVVVDAERRIATVGAGATWAAVNAEAQKHGLLGRAGSAPSVSVSGYTFGGGVGWLVRRDGLASGALRRVRYLDGRGRERIAADDAPDALDRDAIRSFRGAGGVELALELELGLVPVPALHAGTLMWSAADLDAVVGAWTAGLGEVGPSVSSSLAVLHVPPAPVFPEALRGRVGVVLAIADPEGPDGAAGLLAAMRAAAPVVSDDWGPADAARLAQIHLDPQAPTPARGDARWLTAAAADLAVPLFRTAVADDSPVVMLELRHVAGAPDGLPGAVTAPHGAFIGHGVAPLGRSTPEQADAGLARMRDAWAAADAGLTPGSWVDGAAVVPDALPSGELAWARELADRVDPDHRIRRSRLLGLG